MRIALPHQLGREEVRRRMHENADKIGSYFPEGTATVETSWPNEDQMDLLVKAWGQRVDGFVEIEEEQVIIEFSLPAILSIAKPLIEKAIRKEGGKLLEKH
ncbi:MAG: polyhydroxyalkanoic acid system family protein [Pseudomonadota bacterium]